MQITLNESESKQYIEHLDKMKTIADIETTIDILKGVKLLITPSFFRFDSRDKRTISWESATATIGQAVKNLNDALDKITNKYQTRQS